VLGCAQEPAATPALEVGLGAGRRERFLWCVEKLTELEVARVTPLLSATVQHRVARARDGATRLSERALARAAAALKQSRGTHLPEVPAPLDPREWASRQFDGLSVLLAFPAPGVRPLAAVVASARARAFRLAVGPEGGFLPDEEAALARAGFVPAHLGRRRLRFETAAVAAVCQVRAACSLLEDACSS
jgi:16S rRNA (uracil1498-N3)-methyltransferase